MKDIAIRPFSNNMAEFLFTLKRTKEGRSGHQTTHKPVTALGFDAVAYSARPKSPGKPGLFNLVFLASLQFNADFFSHYDQSKSPTSR